MEQGGQYYLDMNGATAGPFAGAEVAELLRMGSITEATLFARPGGVQWMPVGSILPLLRASVPQVAPPVLAAPAAAAAPAPARPVARRELVAPDDWYCQQCGSSGYPHVVTPGSWVITLLLLCLAIIPGLIYSIWRGSARYRVCAVCGSRQVVPVTAPAVRHLVEVHNEIPTWQTILHRFVLYGLVGFLGLAILGALVSNFRGSNRASDPALIGSAPLPLPAGKSKRPPRTNTPPAEVAIPSRP